MCSISPAVSVKSNVSNSSRLSQEEIENILTSPYNTGYTYSQSAAYRRKGSLNFRHPQLCRQFQLYKNSKLTNFDKLKNYNKEFTILNEPYVKQVLIRFIKICLFCFKCCIVFLITIVTYAGYIGLMQFVKFYMYFIHSPINFFYYTVSNYYNCIKTIHLRFKQNLMLIWNFFIKKFQKNYNEKNKQTLKNELLNESFKKPSKLLHFFVKIIFSWTFWILTFGLVNNKTSNSITSPIFTSTPTFAALNIKRKKKEQFLPAKKPKLLQFYQFNYNYFGSLLIRIGFFFIVLFLLHSIFNQINLSNNYYYNLTVLKNKINQLNDKLNKTAFKFELQNKKKLLFNQDKEKIIEKYIDKKINLQLNANIKRLILTEYKTQIVDMLKFQHHILENTRNKLTKMIDLLNLTLKNFKNKNVQITNYSEIDSFTQKMLFSTNLTLNRIKNELDQKFFSFEKLFYAQEQRKDSKLLIKLKNLKLQLLQNSQYLNNEELCKNESISKDIVKTAIKADNLLNLEKIKNLIKEHIQLYDADKTGLPDYALESSGGSIVSTRCTVPYKEQSRTQMIFGIPLWYTSYSPRSVIQRKGYGASAGECWAFVGSHGYLTIKLSSKINVTAVSYEHLPIQLSPNGQIQTAPRQFLVYSYQNVDNMNSKFLLGNFTYNSKGDSLQTFYVENYNPLLTEIVELEVISNYGALVTCLYRFRVHGNLSNVNKDFINQQI